MVRTRAARYRIIPKPQSRLIRIEVVIPEEKLSMDTSDTLDKALALLRKEGQAEVVQFVPLSDSVEEAGKVLKARAFEWGR